MDLKDQLALSDHVPRDKKGIMGTALYSRFDDDGSDLDDDEVLSRSLTDNDFAHFHLTTYTMRQSCSFITCVPLAWVNRLVSVKLDHGEVIGVLGDANLRDCSQVHLTAVAANVSDVR